MPNNALIDEKSPYLRQHASNPVNWMPWGDAAFTKARTEDRPIFLSIGYSTCHWCHVMAHESFEDPDVAKVLNEYFVPVKVDREERPDVDRIYMLFVQASTGSGGWPMSVWLTPELQPFFGGTYFPPDSRYGRPGFKELSQHLAKAWSTDRQRVIESGRNVTEQLSALSSGTTAPSIVDESVFEAPFAQFRRMFDPQWGGFGTAPKFPRPVVFNYLLRFYAATGNEEALGMVTHTLRKMADGGMHDQLGGGFHRYSVDERWFVPHFEKMLYDQAQLAVSYLEAYQITKEERFADVARGIFGYVLRDLHDERGGFHSAEDADSPDPENPSHSGEGAFYIWTQAEIERTVDPEVLQAFLHHYGIEPDGNVENDPQGEFTGRNILYLPAKSADITTDSRLAEAQKKLFTIRERRPRPHLDDKVLTSWNSLMISALAKGFAVLADEHLLKAAEAALQFLIGQMQDEKSGLLLRRYSDGEAAIHGFLDDYAFFAQALLDMFEITGKAEYLKRAQSLAGDGFRLFEDAERGGFFATEAGAGDLLLRLKDDYDGAEPSGNAVATDVLLRLSHLTGDLSFEARAGKSLEAAGKSLSAQPTMAPQIMVALGRSLHAPKQIVYRCEVVDQQLLDQVRTERQSFEPNVAVLLIDDHSARQLAACSPFLAQLERKGRYTIYRCENFTCSLPQHFS